MDKTYFISQSTSLTLVIVISLIFALLGLHHSKKYQGLNNYLTANRSIGLFSLSTSLIASALGSWILFGPASAATWGGYTGLLLLGGVFVSIGLFTSSISNNQVVAFMLSVAICFLFYLGFGFIASFFEAPYDLIFLKVGIAEHYSSIQRGVIDSRDVVYYLSVISFFLMLTKLVLQSRKW